MATKKVTVTIDEDYLEHIRRLVDEGKASSISGYVQDALRATLENEAIWAAMLDEALERTGGPLTDEEREWAQEILGTSKKSKPKRRTVA